MSRRRFREIVSLGTTGLVLTVLGGIGRIAYYRSVRTRGLHPIEIVSELSLPQIALAGLSAILVLVGGLIGLWAAARGDGTIRGVLGAAVALAVFVLVITLGVL